MTKKNREKINGIVNELNDIWSRLVDVWVMVKKEKEEKAIIEARYNILEAEETLQELLD